MRALGDDFIVKALGGQIAPDALLDEQLIAYLRRRLVWNEAGPGKAKDGKLAHGDQLVGNGADLVGGAALEPPHGIGHRLIVVDEDGGKRARQRLADL